MAAPSFEILMIKMPAVSLRVPATSGAALEKMRASEFMKSYFGARFVGIFTTIKENEADRFFAEPQPLDSDFYLRAV